ncbi:MAG: O-antigen ligase family protein [Anaerolineales bacterium]|nr:O-antigen ligase family protein [Anaerolineales bacterium]
MLDLKYGKALFSNNPWVSAGAVAVLCVLTAVLGGVIIIFGGPLAAAAVTAVVVVALLVLRDMQVGFMGVVGVVCLLPFAAFPVDIGITPTFLDAAMGAVIGVWALRLATGRQRRVISSPITLPLFAFLLVAVFSFVLGLQHGALTSYLLRHFAEMMLSIGFAIIVVDYCRSWERVERIVYILILGASAAAVVGIGLYFLPDELANSVLSKLGMLGYPTGDVLRYIEDNPELAERAIGTSVDPNVFGGMLSMALALAVPHLFTEKPFLPRRYVAALVGVLGIGLLLTFSRGSMMAAVAGIIFIAVLRYPKLLIVLVLAGVLVLILPWTQSYVLHFVEGIQIQDLATQMRIGEYTDALKLMARYPLFGVGFAGSPDIDLYLGVAMVYLTIGGEMGVLGLLAFMAVIGTLLAAGWRVRETARTWSQKDVIWLGVYAAIVVGLVGGIFDHYLFNLDFHHSVTLFWLMVGLAAASARLLSVESKNHLRS